MDPIIKSYPGVPIEDLMYCYQHGVAYQRDMSVSVAYDKDYYEKYIGYEGTEIADRLNECRIGLTEQYCDTILDIGVGSGEFIKRSKIKVFGFDINPYAIDWLHKERLFVDPYVSVPDKIQGISLWDTLEHIPNPNKLLNSLRSGCYAFISIPIFDDLSSIKKNKHYRPNEHYYYFTEKGLVGYMEDNYFDCIDISDCETRAGREDVLSFVFRRL
jgi:hypothetical protein